MDRKSVWAAAAALLLAFLLPLCAAFAEEAPGFVSQRRQSYGAAAAWSLRAAAVSRILDTAGLL